MKVESTTLSGANIKVAPSAAESVERKRKTPDTPESEPTKGPSTVSSEEILSKIKDLTEDGLYSIRFEMNKETNELIIQVVEKESGELIRQIPSQELIEAAQKLEDYRGLIIKTES